MTVASEEKLNGAHFISMIKSEIDTIKNNH